MRPVCASDMPRTVVRYNPRNGSTIVPSRLISVPDHSTQKGRGKPPTRLCRNASGRGDGVVEGWVVEGWVVEGWAEGAAGGGIFTRPKVGEASDIPRKVFPRPDSPGR